MTEHEEKQRERLAHLVTALLEQTISATETQELQELLGESPGLQHYYVELMQDINSLRWWSNISCPIPHGVAADIASPARRLRSWKGVAAIGATLAASIALVAISIAVATRGDRQQLANDRLKDDPQQFATAPELIQQPLVHRLTGVATVLRSKGVRWSPKAPPLKELSRLSVGQTLEFAEGEVEIAFDRAVHMVVRGPARFEIRSALEVYSDYGTLSARVGELGKGFLLETPSGKIVDLGTEFGVAIDRDGKTDVAVFRGAVDLTYGDRLSPLKPSIARTLTQGQALTFDVNGSMEPLLAIDNGRFPDFGRHAPLPPQKSTIFGEISDNRSGIDVTFYRIVPGGLRDDVAAYVDRQHEWNGVDEQGIPAPLLGADYIMPFNEDKYLRTLELSVEILRPSRVYIFLSEQAKEPDWLKELCTKTDMVIGLDESGEFSQAGYELATGPGQGVDTRFSVWERVVTTPGTLALGSVQQRQAGWGFCMYGIAAVPLGDEP